MSHFLFGIIGSVVGALGALALAWWVAIVSRPSSSDERLGAAFLMFLAPMAGAVLGFVGGVTYSKLAQAGQGLQFLQAVGRGAAGILVLCALSGVWMWWKMDRDVRIDGKLVEMEFEFRMPAGYVPPDTSATGEISFIRIAGRDDNRYEYHLRNQDAKLVDGRMVLRGIIPLQTDPRDKDILFYLGNDAVSPGPRDWQRIRFQGSFRFPAFRAAKEDLEWTAWLRSAWNPNQPKPGLEECFNLRYRLQFRQPGRENQTKYSIE